VGVIVGRCEPTAVGKRDGVNVPIDGREDGDKEGDKVLCEGWADATAEGEAVGFLVGPPLMHCRLYPDPTDQKPELQIQALDPRDAEAELRGQGRQLEDPAKLNWPEGQIEHTNAPLAVPWFRLANPALHMQTPSIWTLLGITSQDVVLLAVGVKLGTGLGRAVGIDVVPLGAATHRRVEPEPMGTNPFTH